MISRSFVPLCFTMAALCAGFFSLLQTAMGNFAAAAQWILLSMVLDGFDGKIARALKATSPIGAQFDTFVDFTSFGLAPAFLAYQAVLKDHGAIGLVFACAFILSGAYRLSRFRVMDPHGGERGFLGLPITVAGGWIAIFVYLADSGVTYLENFNLDHGPWAAFVWTAALVMILLQVSTIHYPKATKDAVVFAAGVLGILCLVFQVKLAAAAALGLAGYGFFLAFVTPLLPSAARHEARAVLGEEDEDEDEEEDPLPFKPS